MHGEPSDKLQIVQTHLQLFGSLTIIFVAESGLFGANVKNPVIGDGHFVGIPSQVFQHGFGMTKGPFGIDHPGLLEKLIDQFLLRYDPCLERFHILGPEDFAHRLDRKEVLALSFGRLPLLVLSQSTSWNDTVQMGMKAERLSPSVQNGDHSGSGPQMFGVLGKAADRLPGGFKQTVIDSLGLVHRQLIQRIGQGKHDMEVGNREQLGFSLGNPFLPVLSLTLRTVSVSATVIADPGSPAVGTSIHMSTQVSGPTTFERRKRPQLPAVDLRMMFHLGPVLPQHLCHFVIGSQRRDRYSRSRGLKARHLSVWATCR